MCHNPICKTAHAPISCAHDRTARGAAQLRFMEGLVEAVAHVKADGARRSPAEVLSQLQQDSSKWHAVTVSQIRRAITQAKKMDTAAQLWSWWCDAHLDGCIKPSVTSPDPAAPFSYWMCDECDFFVCQPCATAGACMPCEHDIECWDGNFCLLSPRSINRLPYQTPRPHPTVPIAEQIYLLTYGRSRDWHAEWLRREARNGHRPMAEFEACISDGRSRENGNGRPLTCLNQRQVFKMRAERARAGD